MSPLASRMHVETDAQYEVFVKLAWHALHGQNLILHAVPAASIMLGLTDRVAPMPFSHFLEDEFTEVEKVLFFREEHNSSVCM